MVAKKSLVSIVEIMDLLITNKEFNQERIHITFQTKMHSMLIRSKVLLTEEVKMDQE